MERNSSRLAPAAKKELITFVGVAAVCLALTIYLGVTAPQQKRMADYLAHGIFSALCAVPTGAAWRSFRRTLSNRGD